MGEALGLIVMWVTGSGVWTGITPVGVATLRSRETRRPVTGNDDIDVWLGRDVGKQSHHACALDRHGERIVDKPLGQAEAQIHELLARLGGHGCLCSLSCGRYRHCFCTWWLFILYGVVGVWVRLMEEAHRCRVVAC